MNRIISITRDHKETFTSKDFRRCENFVKGGYISVEEGIDDQYTIFYFSKDTSRKVIEWVVSNKYSISHLIGNGVKFVNLNDLIDLINKKGEEWDVDSWEELTIS